jgi:hypothetical protein
MDSYRLVVFTNPVAGREAEYNDWYDNRHLDDVLNVPGFYKAQRFRLENPMSAEPAEYDYLAIYEFESDDLGRTLDHFFSITNTDKMPISTAMDGKAKPAIYRVIGPGKQRSEPAPWPD